MSIVHCDRESEDLLFYVLLGAFGAKRSNTNPVQVQSRAKPSTHIGAMAQTEVMLVIRGGDVRIRARGNFDRRGAVRD
jgi:hypothetical protein